MSIKVEIIKDNIVFFPSNSVEAYGLVSVLAVIAEDSRDDSIIRSRFEVNLDEILQEED